MPQLSPMMGFIMFLAVMAMLLTFLMSVSKKPATVSESKVQSLKKPSFIIFK